MFRSLLIGMIYCTITCFSLNGAELCLTPIGEDVTKDRALWLKNHSIIFLTNEQVIYLQSPPFEDKTWSEWLLSANHVQPDPQFYFDLQKWKCSSLFQIYSYRWDEGSKSCHPLQKIFEKNPHLFDYPYMIENLETGEMTLCQIWSYAELASFIIRYGDECYNAGYNDGHVYSR